MAIHRPTRAKAAALTAGSSRGITVSFSASDGWQCPGAIMPAMPTTVLSSNAPSNAPLE